MPSPRLDNISPVELEAVDITPYKAGNTGIDYVTTFDSGKPGPHVAVTAVVHGNELCGAIAVYNDTGRPAGPGNYLNLISRRGRMEGFITLDYWDRFDECFTQLKTWAAEGKLRWREELVDGLDRCPDALNMLFTGANTGKVVVQVVPEP